MNIYEKLQSIRSELKDTNLKKTGKNNYAGYEYFELQDFVPSLVDLMCEYKVTSVIKYTSDMATMDIINLEKPDEKITFSSPMSSASLKGCHEVQNLGAVETYLRRYLYITAFDIVEADILDKTHDTKTKNSPETAQKSNNKPKATSDTGESKMRIEITDMLKSMYGEDLGLLKNKLEEFSGFEGKNGYVKGKCTTHELKGNWLKAVHSKITNLYQDWNNTGKSLDEEIEEVDFTEERGI